MSTIQEALKKLNEDFREHPYEKDKLYDKFGIDEFIFPKEYSDYVNTLYDKLEILHIHEESDFTELVKYFQARVVKRYVVKDVGLAEEIVYTINDEGLTLYVDYNISFTSGPSTLEIISEQEANRLCKKPKIDGWDAGC